MQSVEQIIKPRWLVPVDPKRSVLEHSAVVVDRGRIVAVGPISEIDSSYKAEIETSLDDHVLMPGFINTHTHAAMSLFRGFADDMPLMQWLTEHIWPAESKFVDPGFMQAGTNLAIAEMLRSGTTCFNDMYFFPDVVAACAEKAGMRASVGMIVIDFPTVWADNADEYINKGLEVRDSVRHSKLINAVFAPHAPYTVSDEPLEKIARISNELECPVHMHVHETAHEIEESTARYGMRPLERLDQLGLLNNQLLAVHMTQLLQGEIETVAQRGVHVLHCPESNLKLASGFCPVNELLKNDINIALGTDGASSNNDLDMLGELRTASLLAKGVSNDPTSVDAYSAIEMATINGARALGLDEITGSIESGKQADLTAIDLSNCSTQPVYNPVSQVVYSASRDQVSDVWVAGKQQLKDGKLIQVDEAEICAIANQWRDKIDSKLI